MSTTTIHHIVILDENIKNDDCSLFQGFSRLLLDEYRWVFNLLTVLPHDALEIFLDGHQIATSKMAGSSLDIFMTRVDLIENVGIATDQPFTIFYSSQSTQEVVRNFLSRFNYLPIHISNTTGNGVISADSVTFETIFELLKQRFIEIGKYPQDLEIKNSVPSFLRADYSPPSRIKIPFSVINHNCVRPLVSTLKTYGYYAHETHMVADMTNNSEYIQSITSLTALIDNIRAEVIKECELPDKIIKNDAIIFAPSLYAHLYDTNKGFWRSVFSLTQADQKNFIKKAIIRTRNYSNNTIEFKNGPLNPYDDPVVCTLLSERQKELDLFTQIISIVATNQFSPAIRLPNDVMLHHDILENISGLIRGGNKKKIFNLNKKIVAYNTSIKNEIGGDLLQAIFSNRRKLLAICDFPVEWISFDGTPVMFTHEISRIGTTPGNLLTRWALSGQRLMIPHNFFKKILVIRSFAPNDPIKNLLWLAISKFAENDSYKNIDIEFVDVNTISEVRDKLNSFEGSIVVFDCHGNHGGQLENGWLNIGSEKMDTWQLGQECRIPPIVMLSACSTHAIDGSHASVTNGFLRWGTISVLGTYAPINAMHSAAFIARIFYRISAFLPIITTENSITWREFMSGFFRMSYITDLLRGFEISEKIINSEQYNEIHFNANMFINSNQKDWLEKTINSVAAHAKIPASAVRDLIDRKYQFVESMLYSHIGRPENLIIYKTPTESGGKYL